VSSQISGTLLGAAMLAYTFGRHGVDGAHIVAIDDATQTPQAAERAPSGRLFITMGHSMVVVIGMVSATAAAIALSRPSFGKRAVFKG